MNKKTYSFNTSINILISVFSYGYFSHYFKYGTPKEKIWTNQCIQNMTETKSCVVFPHVLILGPQKERQRCGLKRIAD